MAGRPYRVSTIGNSRHFMIIWDSHYEFYVEIKVTFHCNIIKNNCQLIAHQCEEANIVF